ncbi:MAG: hypothetical protein JNG88_09720 [Phycisphaerales bacterium]|nr:hypothetical protein [Phycisphaerales bacterium]
MQRASNIHGVGRASAAFVSRLILVAACAAGCDSSRWSVTLHAVTEQTQPPTEPASYRSPARYASDEKKPTTQPANCAANTGKQIETQWNRPLKWDKADEVEESPPSWAMRGQDVVVHAIARDGTNLDKRSSASGGASLSANDRTLTLFARTLRDCMYHASSGEAVGMLKLDLKPYERVVIECDAFGEVECKTEAQAASPQPAAPAEDQHAQVNPSPPDDQSDGTLIIEAHPEWSVRLASSGTVSDCFCSLVGLSGGRPVLVSVCPRIAPHDSSHTVTLYLRNETIHDVRGVSGARIVVQNLTGDRALGHLSFRVSCFNDADRRHPLFKKSMHYDTQLEAWNEWADRWNRQRASCPAITRNASAGARLTIVKK